jgi:CTP:molybdopterin cytidylyltransferase MocA
MVDSDNSIDLVPALILAGGTNDQTMRDATGVQNRALVELTPGRTMLDYVLAAVKAAKCVSHIVVAGDVPDSPDYQRLPSATTFLENLIQGVQALPDGSKQVLIVTSDIPFITALAIDDFVLKSLATGADINYPIIPMDVYRSQYGQMKRTTLKLAEGEFTGGNIVLMSCRYVREHQQTIRQAYSARKDIGKLGRMLGWGLLTRIVLSQTVSPKLLSIPPLEAGVSNLLGHGAKARAVITQYASLGTDIDKPDDVAQARRILAQK